MDTKSTVIGLIVGLLAGAAAGYAVTIPSLQSLQSQATSLQAQLNAKNADITNLTVTNQKLLEDIDYLNDSYLGLQKALNYSGLINHSREVVFTLNATTSGYDEKTITFDVGYGILMDVYVNLRKTPYESEIDIEVSWRRDDTRGFLGGLGNAPAEGYGNVTVRAFCEIFDQKSNQMWVKAGAQIIELKWILRDASTTFATP